MADLQFSDIRFTNSKKARTIKSLISEFSQREFYARKTRHASIIGQKVEGDGSQFPE